MFEISSGTPRWSGRFVVSGAIHAGIVGILIVRPLWAVSEPIDPIERMTRFRFDIKESPTTPARISASSSEPEPRGKRYGGVPPSSARVSVSPHALLRAPIDVRNPESNPQVDADPLPGGEGGPLALGEGPGIEIGPRGDPNSSGESSGAPAIYAIGSFGVTPPVATSMPDPVYPETARRIHSEGDVILEAVIGEDGAVREVRVLRSVNPLLDRAAVEALTRWRYRPARIGERTVAVYLEVRISFRLR